MDCDVPFSTPFPPLPCTETVLDSFIESLGEGSSMQLTCFSLRAVILSAVKYSAVLHSPRPICLVRAALSPADAAEELGTEQHFATLYTLQNCTQVHSALHWIAMPTALHCRALPCTLKYNSPINGVRRTDFEGTQGLIFKWLKKRGRITVCYRQSAGR